MRNMCLIKMDSKDIGLLILFLVVVVGGMTAIFAMDTIKVNIPGA